MPQQQQPHLETTTTVEEFHAKNNQEINNLPINHKKPTITKIVKIDYSPRRPKSTDFRVTSEIESSQSNSIKTHSNVTDKCDTKSIEEKKTAKLPLNLPDLQSNFLKNKNERNKCTDELQNYLLQHLTANKTDNGVPMEDSLVPYPDSGIPPSTLGSSNHNNNNNNDNNHEANKSFFREEIATKTANISIPISVKKPLTQKPKINVVTKKPDNKPRVKSYDPIKAREYMQEQKKNRSVQFKLTSSINNSNRIQKEEIQKRLATLKENSLKIVANNIKHGTNKISQDKTEPNSRNTTTKRKSAISSLSK